MPSAIRTPNGDGAPGRRLIAIGARARVGTPARGSWREPLNCPMPGSARPDEPVVQPRFASLPEFEAVRRHAQPAPVWRPWHVLRETRLGRRDLRFQPPAIRNRRALWRRPSAYPRSARAHAEVGIGFSRAHRRRLTFYANLPLELRPEKQQRDVRIAGKLASLATVVVRMKDEAARVERLQQHDTRGRPAGRVDGGERHRVRLGYGRSDRLVEPPRELVEGICRRVALVQ